MPRSARSIAMRLWMTSLIRRSSSGDPLHGGLAPGGDLRPALAARHAAQHDRREREPDHDPDAQPPERLEVTPGPADLDSREVGGQQRRAHPETEPVDREHLGDALHPAGQRAERVEDPGDRKSTRLNSSHLVISYAVFCLKKKIYRIE